MTVLCLLAGWPIAQPFCFILDVYLTFKEFSTFPFLNSNSGKYQVGIKYSADCFN